MSKKRLGNWVMVLFLLAALPGMTAVMAQGQEPPAKADALAPAAEEGETITPFPWRSDEIAGSNDTRNGPGVVEIFNGNVYGGTISQAGDIDYWKIPGYWGDDLNFLFNIDAQSFGSPLDSVICLYSDDNVEMGCNNDAGGTAFLDSLLYFQLEGGRDYYLMVKHLSSQQGGSNYRYQLQVTQPLLVSAAAAQLPKSANVMGIPIQSGDILAWSNVKQTGSPNITYEKWVMLLDLSDLGVKGSLVNLSSGWRNSDYLLVGFGANVTLPGITGVVTPWEVVIFNPTRVGPTTAGTFQRWWDGKGRGLTTTAEKPDAIEWPQWNGTTRLSVSTAGAASVSGQAGLLKLADEDVAMLDFNTIAWKREFDGSGWWQPWALNFGQVNFGLGAKDVIGYSYSDGWGYDHDWWEDFYVVLQGTGTVMGNYKDDWGYIDPFSVSYTQKDILDLECYGTDNDEDGCYPCVWWHGPDHGWNYNLDAIETGEEASW